MTGVFLLLAALVVMVLFLVLAKKQYDQQFSAKYRRTKPLSEVEQVLYWRLVEALPECVILSQVTFSRFMTPERVGGKTYGEFVAMRNRIAQKSIDYLVCLKDFTVVAALELDDATHVAEKDHARDALLRSAGIEVLRVNVKDIPSAARLREVFTMDTPEVTRP